LTGKDHHDGQKQKIREQPVLENSPKRTIVQRTTELTSRRKNTFRFEGGAASIGYKVYLAHPDIFTSPSAG